MIKIVCIGKIKEHYLDELINDYKTRISKYHKIEIVELKDNNINDESNEILKCIKKDDYNILMDINSEEYSSIEFSHFIDNTLSSINSNITFIIGGSNGVDDRVKSIVKKRVSFSKLTFPHGLFRGILLEQIYRSFKIMTNESYHK